jgi:PPOX class probable FMN-dependent enzyme
MGLPMAGFRSPASCESVPCYLGRKLLASGPPLRQGAFFEEQEEMSDFIPDPDFIIRSRDEVQQIVGATYELAIQKFQRKLGKHAKEFIRRSPFVCIGSQGVASGADVSPLGDPTGFVQILDDRTLAIPDRPGNNRVDTLLNILENDRVGLLFIIPGFDDTLRVNGRAILTNEPELMDEMAVNGRSPGLAIVVKVDEVFIHCAKAFRRSHLWSPDHFQKRSEMPSLVKIVLDETTEEVFTAEEQRKRDEALEHAYQNTLY